jgi:hypothetical protein
VATAVVLLPATHREPWLQSAATTALARLGVTGIAVVRDDRTLGLVVEGWAFDPIRSAGALLEALGAQCETRTLYPVLEMAVSPAARPASPASSSKEERNASVLGDSDRY